MSTPLNNETLSLLEQSDAAFVLIHQATTAETLGWPDSVENPAALIERNRIIRPITGLLALRARQAFENQRFERGFKAIMTSLKVSRDAGQTPNLMSQMIEAGTSRVAIEVMANILPSLPTERLPRVATALQTLPPSPSLSEALAGEYRHGTRLARRQAADSQGNAAVGVMFNAYRELEPFFVELGKHSAVNPEEFSLLLDAEISDHYPSNVVVKGIAPMLKHHHLQHTMVKTRWALFNAGLNYLLKGEAAITENQAPAAAQPIQLELTEKGFRLVSHLSYRGTPVSLSFGE